MIDYTKEFGPSPAAVHHPGVSLGVSNVFVRVYGWMTAGLVVSGLVAWYTVASGLYQKVLTGPGYLGCVVAELALVFILSAAYRKLPPVVAALMFIGYAALNGLTLSIILLAFDLGLVQQVFFITAGMFLGLAIYGTVTKSDLSSIGSLCGMALWGLIIAGVANLFFRSSGLDFALSFIGILVFTGLTMYDAKRIKYLDDSTGIIGALMLYLDFVNLFLYILRFMSKRNND